MSETKGQNLVNRLEQWIAGYMFFTDPGISLVCALWVIHTWVFEHFDATPYLCINAATKGAGKTRLAELLALTSRNGRMFGGMTGPTMFRLMEQYDSKLTLFFDEAESLSSNAASLIRSVMNMGYRKGQFIPRTLPGNQGVREYPVFCPKAFMLIGDPTDTLRDRSIILTLVRGQAGKTFDRSTAEYEANTFCSELASTHFMGLSASPQVWLKDRDREIWSAIFGVAESLGLDQTNMKRLVRVSADLVAAKTAKIKRYTEHVNSEDQAVADSYGERALLDLRSIFKDGETAIFSAVAVDRMKAIESAPWRTFKGSGLDQQSLADLVSPFGLQPRYICRKIEGKQKTLRGFQRKDVDASSPRIQSDADSLD